MTDKTAPATEPQLTCAKCKLSLVQGKVKASYLGNSFEVELLRCPGCGFIYVPESLALGKMLQVEQALEDK
jgi:ssDNA-binding Zn-finger/Zn-ribbon topoisomerase 1